MRLTSALLVGGVLVLGLPAPPVRAQEDDDPELKGTVVSSATGEPIEGAWIALAGRGFGTYSRRGGEFRLPDVPASARRYDVQALGYLPAIMTLEAATRDQVLELDPDTSVLPGVEFLMGHLRNRRNGARSFDRQALAFSGAFNLGEFLQGRGVRRVRTFCLDERTTPGLAQAPPESFYLVELHGSKVRAYTEEFLESTARNDIETIEDIVRLRMPVC